MKIIEQKPNIILKDAGVSYDTGFKSPSSTGELYNQWTNPFNAYVSDNIYATASGTSRRQGYGNFGISLPANAMITGIEVDVEHYSSVAGTLLVLLYLSGVIKSNIKFFTTSTTETVQVLGGFNDLWGTTWLPNNFSDGTFQLLIYTGVGAIPMYLDHIKIKVYYSVPNIKINSENSGCLIKEYRPAVQTESK